jgi:hypothetical protein
MILFRFMLPEPEQKFVDPAKIHQNQTRGHLLFYMAILI